MMDKNKRCAVAILITTGLVVCFIIPPLMLEMSFGPKAGYINFHRFGTNDMYLKWSPAIDYISPPNLLEYRVYASTTNNIRSVQDMERNGVLLCDWTPGLDHINVGSSYFYFNVMVRDIAGKISAYPTSNQGDFTDLGEALAWMAQNATDKNKIATVDLESENATRLGLVGMALMETNESVSNEIFHVLGMDHVMVNFGHLISGFGGNEFDGMTLLTICNDHTADYIKMGLENADWFGKNHQVSTVFDIAEYYNSTGAPTTKWFNTTLAKFMFYHEPTSIASATTELNYWYASQISGDTDHKPFRDANGNPWASDIPQNGAYNLTWFSPAFISGNTTIKIYNISVRLKFDLTSFNVIGRPNKSPQAIGVPCAV